MPEILVDPKSETSLENALRDAAPGTVIVLKAGIYRRKKPAVLKNSGEKGNPITIRGEEGAILQGKAEYDLLAKGEFPVLPDDKFSFLLLDGCDWVEIEKLHFRHCWPTAVTLKGCSNVVIRDCVGEYGRYLIFAKNSDGAEVPDKLTESITLERIFWTQDPDEHLWRGRIQWCHVKQETENGECDRRFEELDRRILNGAMFGSKGIHRDITIRHCHVRHAFNAIRMKAGSRFRSRAQANVDVRIYSNIFEYVRDNATEPESYAVNLWIHHNLFRNTYATFSFDNIWGGYWYIFGNLVWTDDALTGACDAHDWVQCFKFHNEVMPRWPIYSFHNSISTPWPYAKEGMTRHWCDFNNAVEFLPGGNPHMGRETLGDRFAPYFKTPRQYLCWDPTYQFRQTLTNHPDFPEALCAYGMLVSGRRVDQVFVNGPAGDLALPPGSCGSGASIDMPIAFADGKAGVLWGGKDIGAIQPGGAYDGPSYIEFQPHQQAGENNEHPDDEG